MQSAPRAGHYRPVAAAVALVVLCRPCGGWQCGVALRDVRAQLVLPARGGLAHPRRSRVGRGVARWTGAAAEPGSSSSVIRQELLQTQVARRFPTEAEEAARAVDTWAARMEPQLCARVNKGPRLLKEVQEAIPIMHWVKGHLTRLPPDAGKVTLVDMCSGFGYASMLLADTLPPERLAKILLVDRSWPLASSPPRAHHISMHHLHADVGWRVPLTPVRCNVNKRSERSKLNAIFSSAPGPVILFGVHLCGALSMRAVELFNQHPQATFFALKPCCLPSNTLQSQHRRALPKGGEGGGSRPGGAAGLEGKGAGGKELAGARNENGAAGEDTHEGFGGTHVTDGTWGLGGYVFPLGDVVARGRFKAGRWVGESRAEMAPKFRRSSTLNPQKSTAQSGQHPHP